MPTVEGHFTEQLEVVSEDAHVIVDPLKPPLVI
jgi:hypothetical protein